MFRLMWIMKVGNQWFDLHLKHIGFSRSLAPGDSLPVRFHCVDFVLA